MFGEFLTLWAKTVTFELIAVALYLGVRGLIWKLFDRRCQRCGHPYAIYRRATMDLCGKHKRIHDAEVDARFRGVGWPRA